MTNLRVDGLEGRPLFDLGSFARRGPGRRDRLTSEELSLIGRTVRHTPEVMVKVLSKDSNILRSVARHLNYIGRRGELELETDDGDHLQERDAGRRLVENWDLDLDQNRRDSKLSAGTSRAPKLVHKIILSMPPGTPAGPVLEAARKFAREEFALKHRYALVLHTDEPHPHVHLVVKAVSEQGERLNIRKSTLREWRREFARQLQEQGVEANATERAVRGSSRLSASDGVYRTDKRGESHQVRKRAEALAVCLSTGRLPTGTDEKVLLETRRRVQDGWAAVGAILESEGNGQIAAEVRRFVLRMEPPTTADDALLKRMRNRDRSMERSHSR